ncbi:hypothetical protein TNCV_2298571 [Trichonephila clavipes]|nr:hypothetical protein TNCV_2298571 [Trichonephila clavipes]
MLFEPSRWKPLILVVPLMCVWLHIYADDSLLDFTQGTDVGIFCNLFSFYLHVDFHTTNFDGKVEVIRLALLQPSTRLSPPDKAVVLSDSCSALQALATTRGLLATDHVILNHGQVTWTTPELAPPSPNYHTTPTGGRFSSRQIYRASLPYTAGL